MAKVSKKILTFSILMLFFVIILAGCGEIAKYRYIEKKVEERVEKINNTEANLSDKKTDGQNNEPDTPQVNLFKPGDYKIKINQGNTERYYLLHVPKSYKGQPTSLILAFHGGTGTAEGMMSNYGLTEKSDKEGFIAAFPNGASKFTSGRLAGKLATWNAGNCCGYAVQTQSDDVGFVKAVISDIKSKININKIYAAGMSNGGMLSHRLACEMPDTFSAIASVSGTNNFDGCNPKKPISVLHIHGLQDDHVLFNGGCGPACNIEVETEFTSVSDTISGWVERNNCNENSKRVLEKENAYCDLYTGCDDDVQVKLCVVEDGGHSWPGTEESPNPLEKSTPSQAISATDEIWNFFKNIQ